MSRVPAPDTAFTLSRRIKRPRERDEKHLAFVRTLPCCYPNCFAESVPAHIRMGALEYGKPGTGGQEKPSDKYVVPLCPPHHTDGPNAQHRRGEAPWWAALGMEPILLSALLYQVSGDYEAAVAIIRHRPRRVFMPLPLLEARI